MSAARTGTRSRPEHGFTLLEILIAMAIFTVLGTMVVYFMRQSLSIFSVGTRESAILDRMDTILPQVRVDLQAIALPDNYDVPPPQPSEEELERRQLSKPPPEPPVRIRLRSGYVYLSQLPDASYKGIPCPYLAFVIADAGEWSNKLKRRAGDVPVKGAALKPLTPDSVQSGDRSTQYLPTGGLTEVLWIAVPTDVMRDVSDTGPRYPAIMTLYRGYRSPIGHPELSLLDPENFDSPDEIRKACRPVAEGLLHFGALWRRVFSKDWDAGIGIGIGETSSYVGQVWDSSRGTDKDWILFKGKESLSDPSDDIFPRFVRLEATLASASQTGAGRGELRLREAIGDDAVKIKVTDTDPLLSPNLGRDRWLKVGHEWMQYTVRDVNWETNEVRVSRGKRGSKPTAHRADTWCYVGAPSSLEVSMPVFRDRFVLDQGGGGR